MIFLVASMLLAELPAAPFPERTPGLMEECLLNAVATGDVDLTESSHKYICSGQSAERLWAFLENSKVVAYEQDAGAEGHWLSRDFPMGGCFKRTRMADGNPAASGLSCTIWVPRMKGQ